MPRYPREDQTSGSARRSGAGRPTKFTPELAKKIVDMLSRGNFLETAAAAAGVHPTTMRLWLKHGTRADAKAQRGIKLTGDEPALARFSSMVRSAIAESEAADVETIRQASAQQWTAAAWRLERRFAERWAKRQHYNVVATTASKAEARDMSTAELMEIIIRDEKRRKVRGEDE